MTGFRRLLVALATVALVASLAASPAAASPLDPAGAPAPHAAAAPPTSSSDTTGVLIVLDTSGSMRDQDGQGTVKIEGAKAGIISLVNTIPAGNNVGLVTYPSDDNCGDPRQVIPFGPLDPDSFTKEVAGLPDPNGGTPTGSALKYAAEQLDAAGATSATIVLVSDGESNCDPAPCPVAQDLVASGHHITINTVGFNISSQGRDELQCIAQSANGQYYDVTNAGQLGSALEEATRPKVSVDLQYPNGIIPVDTRTITVTATVSVTNSTAATDVQVSLIPDLAYGKAAMAVTAPVRKLGTLGGAITSTSVRWTLTPNQSSAETAALLTFTVRAANSPPEEKEVTLRFGKRGPGQVTDTSQFHGMKKALVLGDSFSSGEGAGTDDRPYADKGREDEACHRSKNTYAGWLFDDVTILACSGAVTDNLTSAGQHGESAQLDQLSRLLDTGYRPDVVFLTIGGNDIGFSSIVKLCVVANIARAVKFAANWTGVGRILNWSIDIATFATGKDITDLCSVSPKSLLYQPQMDLTEAVAGYLPYLYGDVAQTFARATGHIPPIVVLPYVVLAPLNATTRSLCMPSIAEFQNAALGLDQISDFLTFQLTINADISDAVQIAREKGAPVFFASDVAYALQPDHSMCSAQPWLNPITLGGGFTGNPELVHPNRSGHQAIAMELLRWSQTAGLTLKGADRPEAQRPPAPTIVVGSPPAQQIQITAGSPQPADLTFGPTVVNLQGVPANSHLVLVAHSSPVPLGSGIADANGNATVRFDLDPAKVGVGQHELKIYSLAPDGSLTEIAVPLTVAERDPSWTSRTMIIGSGTGLLGLVVLLVAGLLQFRAIRRSRRAAA